ncbi:unnamed protein product, partial [Protopolystoma xenopodis]
MSPPGTAMLVDAPLQQTHSPAGPRSVQSTGSESVDSESPTLPHLCRSAAGSTGTSANPAGGVAGATMRRSASHPAPVSLHLTPQHQHPTPPPPASPHPHPHQHQHQHQRQTQPHH